MSKTKSDYKSADTDQDRDLYSGLIRLHVLHHAVEEPIFGLGMAEELARHGYRISPGTLYPLLHSLEQKGYLRSKEERSGKSRRKVYRATPLGRKALSAAKKRVRELFRELIEWVDVRTGFADGDLIQVLGNLQPGDQVVRRGTDETRDGTPLQAVK